MIKHYIKVIKPGIIFGNLISVIGGFLLASKGHVDYILFINTLIGVSLVIASSCIFNNYIDRDIDQKMERTQNRIIIDKLIAKKTLIIYAMLLGMSGFVILYIFVNILVTYLAIIGFIIYVIIYSKYMKRKTVYSTLVGSLSGAIPQVIGYCAVINYLDICVLILFMIFIMWQMSHFYSIAIFRLKDYLLIGIPLLPIKHGVLVTKYHIALYIIGFILSTLLLTLTGYTSYNYMIIITLINIRWLIIALQGYKLINNDEAWAHKSFIFSIIVITVHSMMLSIDFLFIS